MPVASLSADQALRNLQGSSVARWPSRSSDANRLLPLARPAFVPSFAFAPGCTVFTMGSCFARNVEVSLQRLGFEVPTRRFWKDDPTKASADNWMLDTYSVPAIYNEIAWALGERPYDPGVNLIELSTGRYADIHLAGRIPLGSLDEVLARRERIFEVTRSLLTADVMILTLGLAEVWLDERTGTYLNTRPMKATLLKEPGRFSLRVLAYEEVKAFLEQAFEIVFRRCRPDLKVVLTVSPVPMAATYTGDDVAIANQYSKSVLRTAAEAIVRANKRIDYYPSYESVVLSERSAVWLDDQVHVRPEVIDEIVMRMIEAYTGQRVALPVTLPDPVGPAAAASAPDLAEAEEHLKAKRYREALRALGAPNDPLPLRIAAVAHLRLGEFVEAERLCRQALAIKANLAMFHAYLGDALFGQARYEEARDSLLRALGYNPAMPAWIVTLALCLERLGQPQVAATALDEGLAYNPGHAALRRARDAIAIAASAPGGSRAEGELDAGAAVSSASGTDQ